MWEFLLGIVGGGGVFGAIAYVYKRRTERAPERDALAIEQAKVQLAQNIRGLLESADPTVRERAQPMLDAMIETSVKALSAPPVRKQLTAAEQRREDDERREEQRKREMADHSERMRKMHEEDRQREEKHLETMVNLYRKPLVNTAMALCIYAERSAQAHAKALNLEEFNTDWEIFKDASREWYRAATGQAKADAKEIIVKIDREFRSLLEQLNRALKRSQPSAERPQLTDGSATADPPKPEEPPA